MDFFATTAIIFTLLAFACLLISYVGRYRNLPPGPRPLPLIGNVLQLSGRDLRDVFRKYRKIYGDIFTIRIFNEIMIVVNGLEDLKEVFVKNGDKFSERNTFETLNAGLEGEGIGLANGEIWKQNRRFVIRTLRDFGMGKSKLQTVIHEEIFHFLEAFEKEEGNPFDIERVITNAVSNIICCLVFGKRFEYSDEEFIYVMRQLKELFSTNIIALPHWFRLIPGDPFSVKRCLQKLQELGTFYKTKVREHVQDFDSNDIRDVIDAFIKQMTQNETLEGKPPINENEIAHCVHDLFTAGTETTTSLLRFALVFIMRNPEVQEKLFKEVRKEVSESRLPNLADCKNMPYLQATVLEIMRRGSVAPFALPHTTKSDQQFRGYTIPKSALIFPNLESALFDKTVWDEPLEFSPSRFFNNDTLLEKIPEELIPFGIGPRSCPGESLARMELTLFLSAMFHRFTFLPPEGEGPPCLATRLGVTSTPVPFKLRAIKRL